MPPERVPPAYIIQRLPEGAYWPARRAKGMERQ